MLSRHTRHRGHMLVAHYTSLRIREMEEMTILLGCQGGMSGKFSFYK